MPVVTTQGVAYSYSALFEMFMAARALPTCKVTGEPIAFFPSVCLPLHHHLMEQYKGVMRGRRQQDEPDLAERFGFPMPMVEELPEKNFDEALLEELECVVSRELVYEPCVLSSGSIVSAYCVPEGGFLKDPNRTVGCALYGQAPRKSMAVEAMIKARFPQHYTERALELAKEGIQSAGQHANGTWNELSPALHIFWGLGCDGCGLWPIRGSAWEDAECQDRVGFHLCDQCYQLGFHRRVVTGKFNQTRMPKCRMVQMAESDFM